MNSRRIGRVLGDLLRTALKPKKQRGQKSRRRGADDGSPGQFGAEATRDLRRDELEHLEFAYDPHLNGNPDPGEVVWTWVPYVENDGRGKDRPVLIIAHLGDSAVAGCYLSTNQRDGFVSIGTGAWDPQGRTSYLSPQRVLRITHSGMRREGHALSRERFIESVRAVVQHWSLKRPD